MKTLFQICLSYVSRNLEIVGNYVEEALPSECKDLILDWISSHDLLNEPSVRQILDRPGFVGALTYVNFYLSEQLEDDLLIRIGQLNKRLTHLTIVYCNRVSDRGIRALTENQKNLVKLELKGIKVRIAPSFLSCSSHLYLFSATHLLRYRRRRLHRTAHGRP